MRTRACSQVAKKVAKKPAKKAAPAKKTVAKKAPAKKKPAAKKSPAKKAAKKAPAKKAASTKEKAMLYAPSKGSELDIKTRIKAVCAILDVAPVSAVKAQAASKVLQGVLGMF